MRINKRILIESLIVSIIIVIFGIVLRILQGYIGTRNYVPDIINQYESVDYLQSEVSIETVGTDWSLWLTGFYEFIVIAIIYYTLRVLFKHYRTVFRNKK